MSLMDRKWGVPYVNLTAQYLSIRDEIDPVVRRVLNDGRYIGGDDVAEFETEMSKYLNVRYVVSCGNGYDALFLAIQSLELNRGCILTDGYTHVSTHAAISNSGCYVGTTPEHRDGAVAYIPVHMNGRMQEITETEIPVIEDACQAIGSMINDQMAGTVGDIGCFSMHPLKTLGVAGDGGFICTQRKELAERVRELRNHGGGKGYGYNSRLDALQAAIATVKLKHLDRWIDRRRDIAAIYERELPAHISKPPAPSDGKYFDTYSSYVIGGSPGMLAFMREKGIECFSHIRDDVVSLPIYPEMLESHIGTVIDTVKAYRG